MRVTVNTEREPAGECIRPGCPSTNMDTGPLCSICRHNGWRAPLCHYCGQPRLWRPTIDPVPLTPYTGPQFAYSVLLCEQCLATMGS